jgi:triosephosphate isomerase
MKKALIVGNWKANPSTALEAKKLLKQIKQKTARIRNADCWIAAPYIFVSDLRGGVSRGKLKIGVQYVSQFGGGSHTGEVTASMAKSVGASFAIVGHSERRALGETDEEINKQIMSALGAGLEVVLCVGEKERDLEGVYLSFITKQLEKAFTGIVPRDLGKIHIAYEPVYAIGKTSDFALKSSDVHEMVIFIRKFLSERFNRTRAESMRVLYGASVERDNAHDLVRNGNVDGLLVGHASLDAEEFATISQLVGAP